jgi:hypothetical protein
VTASAATALGQLVDLLMNPVNMRHQLTTVVVGLLGDKSNKRNTTAVT